MTLPLVITAGDSGHIGDHEEIHALLDDVVSPFTVANVSQGTEAARPAAGQAGRYYYATDTLALFYDTGSAWRLVSPAIRFARVFKTGNQTLSDGTATDITWNGESFDTSGMHSAGDAEITTPSGETGYVAIDAQVTFTGDTLGIRMVQIVIGGTVRKSVTADGHAASGGVDQRLVISDLYPISASTQIKIRGFQDTGGNLAVIGGTDDDGDQSRFSVMFHRLT